jgi:miniconductance mechanosensitive channel
VDALKTWLLDQGLSDQVAAIVHALIAAVIVGLLALLVNYVAKMLIRRVIHPIVRRTETTWDDAFIDRKVITRLSHLAPALVINSTAALAFGDYPTVEALVQSLAVVYFIAVGVSVVSAFLDAAVDVYPTLPVSRSVPIKSFVQVILLVIWILGGIFILAHLIGKSPIVFFTGIGASTAVLMLVFKDTILSLVAGVQLTANKMVQRGDWIEMPKYGVDGDVIDVSLTTIKVQNWDKTISTVPPYALVTDSFRNWRGMSESGGRRIKRSVSIDVASIAFLDEETTGRFKKIRYIKDYLEKKA